MSDATGAVEHAVDESRDRAEGSESKKSKPKWWHISGGGGEPRTKSESRFPVMIAGISAVAALAGAGVGAVASYKRVQIQAAAETNQNLITRKQQAYSNFLAAETILERDLYQIRDSLKITAPPNTPDPVHAAFEKANGDMTDWIPKSFVVELVASHDVDNWRAEMRLQLNGIMRLVEDANSVSEQLSPSERKKRSDELDENIYQLKTGPLKQFIDKAQAEISQLSGR